VSDSADTPVTGRRPHILRLALFGAVILTLFYLVAIRRVVDIDAVRDTVAAAGPVAPLAYIVVAALLAAIFVPGPLLAAGSGLLFGPVLGTVVSLVSTATTAVITALTGRYAGRDSARALIGEQWAQRIDTQIQQRGLWAVVGQRFIPGISDALASYTFGAFGMPYTALGASIADLASPLAYAAIAVWCVMAVIGAFGAHRGYRAWRSRDEHRHSRASE